MRQAFMSTEQACKSYSQGYDACREERSTWESWRM